MIHAPLLGWVDRADVRLALLYGLVGAAIAATPVRLGDFALATPWFGYACAFMLAVTKPDMPATLAVAVLGLAQDYAFGGPVGPFAFGYLLAYGVLAAQRSIVFGQTLAVIWATFAFGLAITVLGVSAAGVLAALAAGAPAFDPSALVGLGAVSEAPSRGFDLGALVGQAVWTALLGPLLLMPLGGAARVRDGDGSWRA